MVRHFRKPDPSRLPPGAFFRLFSRFRLIFVSSAVCYTKTSPLERHLIRHRRERILPRETENAHTRNRPRGDRRPARLHLHEK